MKLRRLSGFAALALVAAGCAQGPPLTRSDADTVLAHLALEAPNPAEPGPYPVARLYYGSGTDRRRVEFRDSVTLKTATVDASKLVSLGASAASRKRYWGFGPDAFPVNGRAWYPDAPGRFPLVLVVHGNHDMKDFSDPGYAYLGELLASRGFITVSVDENFLNGNIQEENDARGWMLLRHLEAWRVFDADSAGIFRGKVDLDRVALIGHSRGGEAVAVAAAFNGLSHYPDDATVRFDFGFGIRSLVAIAPVDGQYLPTGRPTPLSDVNYLVFHGSHDGDVSSFHGLRQYQRVSFTGAVDRFKAAVYMYRANHGQWNTVWNANDNGPRSPRILDLDELVDGEDQRRFGKLYIAAFLEATLRDDDRYRPIFVDHRTVGRWLPPTLFVTRFRAAGFRAVADFEEDIDVTTGSVPGVVLAADSVASWAEKRLDLRSRNRASTSASQVNQAVWLEWKARAAGTDSAGVPGSFRIDLPDSLAASWGVDSTWTLDFLLAATSVKPDSLSDDDARTDLSVEVSDGAGRVARVPVSRYGPVRRPLRISLLRRKEIEKARVGADHEIVLQGFTIPLSDLAREAPGFDAGTVRSIGFVFDRSPAGSIALDEVGFSRLPAGYLSARIDLGR